MSNSDWREVSKTDPCPICQKPDWCARTPEGIVRCMRASEPPSGWRVIKKSEDEGVVFAVINGSQGSMCGSNDWRGKAENFRAALPIDKLTTLAAELGVRAEALRVVGMGWNRHSHSFTFPEREGKRQIIGISTRRPGDGQKLCMKGSRRGLVIPDGLDVNAGARVLIVEGASDVAACVTMGLNAVGRPSAMGGVAHLAELLADADDVLVVGENDGKHDGKWPGRDGAQRVAGGLARRWGRPVSWTLPPEGAKDVRQYLVTAKAHLADVEACKNVGARLLAELRAAVVVIQPEDKSAAPSEAGDEKPKKSQASLLVELVEGAGFDLFHSAGDDSEAYATVPVGDHLETWRVQAKGFRRWLARRFYEESSKAPGAQALQDALNVLTGKAIFEGRECEAPIRLAEHGDAIYLDLCNGQWHSVEITPRGWRVLDSRSVPVRFVRRRGMLALPTPLSGGCVDELRKFVNVPNDDDWTLLIAWLVAALRPTGPYPVLAINGEQGSAKSSLCRFLRALFDPNVAPLRRPPKDEHDLIIAATNGWCVAFDNLSGLPAAMSDALSALATGSGFGKRELYSDNEETLFAAARPIILNGINSAATRSDLLDRAVALTLPPISEEQRRDEAVFRPAFAAALPGILGGLLDAVSAALHNVGTVKLDRLPRMADFARWVTATEPALGWEAGRFMRAYASNRGAANTLVIESTAIGPAILALMAERCQWDGTIGELLGKLGETVDERIRKGKYWPSDARRLADHLRRLGPSLRSAGIGVTLGPHSRRGRTITLHPLKRVGESPSPPPHATQNPPGTSENEDSGVTLVSDVTDPESHRHTKKRTGAPKNAVGDSGDAGDAEFLLCSNDDDTLPTLYQLDAETDPEPNRSNELERTVIRVVEGDEASGADALWAELATLPPVVLKDRASRTDDPETKRRLLSLARKKRKGEGQVDTAGDEA